MSGRSLPMSLIRIEHKGLAQTMLPAPAGLGGIVQVIFDLQGTPAYGTHRLFARPGQHLHINLGDPIDGLAGAAGEARRMNEHLVSGSRSAWFDSRPAGRLHFVGVAFSPTGLHALTGVPQHELTDRDLPLDDLLPPRLAAEWRERLLHATGPDERIELTRRMLMRLKTGRGTDHRSHAPSIAHYILGQATKPMKELERCTGYSRQYLLRLLLERTGMGLREHQQLVRMAGAVTLLNKPGAQLVDVALAAGYYDQAHFTRRFKRFTGLTPSAYLAAERGPRAEPYFN